MPEPGTPLEFDATYDAVAQGLGAVGEGEMPRAEGSPFEFDLYFIGPEPLYIQASESAVIDLGTAIDDHNLAASDDVANAQVIDQLKKDLFH